MTHDAQAMKLTPDALLFAFSPYDCEDPMEAPAESAFYEMQNPLPETCELCGADRALPPRGYGDPAFKVIIHFACGHNGQWLAPQLKAA